MSEMMTDRALTISPEAAQTITAMHQRVDQVAMAYGRHSAEHVDMLESLNRALTSLLRLGGRISRDGDLSLFGASWIAYGVIFHAKYLHDGVHGSVRDPLLGEWSCHS